MPALKPKPKAELSIVLVGDYMDITTHSKEAWTWIAREAPQFCVFFSFNGITGRPQNRALGVVNDESYDPEKVVAYLLSYLNKES